MTCKHTSTIKCDVDVYLCLLCDRRVRYIVHVIRGVKIVTVEEID